MSNASLITTNHIAFQTTAAALAALLLTTTTMPRAASLLLLHLPAETLASWTVVVGTKPVPSASPPSRESTAWTVWPVGEGLPCASTRFGTRSPIFRKRWCLLLFVLYSCFHLLLRSEGRGCPLSQQMPPAPPLRVVMFPTIAIVIYNSLYILCILHESCLSYFIFRSHLSVRACRRLASVSWCCALRRDSAAFCMRR